MNFYGVNGYSGYISKRHNLYPFCYILILEVPYKLITAVDLSPTTKRSHSSLNAGDGVNMRLRAVVKYEKKGQKKSETPLMIS